MLRSLVARTKRLRSSVSARLFYPIAYQVRRKGLTYLSNARLISIAGLAWQLTRTRTSPLFLEFGVALGGSSILMADIVRRAGRGKVVGYDMFGLIPEPSANDGDDAHRRYADIAGGKSKGLKGKTYYGYETDLQAKVAASFDGFGLKSGVHFELVAGDFRRSFREPQQSVDLMHIDCDWHDSVAFCLAAAKDHLSEGGFVVVDDYNDYEGCARAVDDFLLAEAAQFALLTKSPHAIIQRHARPKA